MMSELSRRIVVAQQQLDALRRLAEAEPHSPALAAMWNDLALSLQRFQAVATDRTEADTALQASEARCRELADENARQLLQSQKDAATQALLRRETNHRVKNNLAAIVGLLQMELAYRHVADLTSYAHLVQDLSTRIQSLLLVHNLLAGAQEGPVSLDRLASLVMNVAPAMLPLQQATVQMDISPFPVLLAPRQANALGLILNELTTNALKYAAQDDRPLLLGLRGSRAGRRVELIFSDNGPGYPADVLQGQRQGVGLYLVQNLVENDLRGTVELHNDPGAAVSLTFGLADDLVDGAGPPSLAEEASLDIG
jgi:two-component sensor histidine kinase